MPYQPDLQPSSKQAAAGSSLPSGRLEAARRRNERALMAIDGVEGVAAGRCDDGQPAIVLYVRNASVKARLPRLVDGFPVLASVTGQIGVT